MKKRHVVLTALLLSIIININVPTVFAKEYNSAVPPMLQDLKGKDQLVSIFNNIKSVRANISTIDINALTAKDKSKDLREQIGFYITQLASIDSDISTFEKQFSNSEPDLLFAQQLSLIIESYQMSLNQQLSLLTALENNDPEASTLFSSNYLVYIYYYISLGDQMGAYIDTYYNL